MCCLLKIDSASVSGTVAPYRLRQSRHWHPKLTTTGFRPWTSAAQSLHPRRDNPSPNATTTPGHHQLACKLVLNIQLLARLSISHFVRPGRVLELLLASTGRSPPPGLRRAGGWSVSTSVFFRAIRQALKRLLASRDTNVLYQGLHRATCQTAQVKYETTAANHQGGRDR
jgi:hypothetical protein